MENHPSVHESELGFECFSNFTPAEVFVQGCAGFTNQHDIEQMIRAQKQMFVKTNFNKFLLVSNNNNNNWLNILTYFTGYKGLRRQMKC